MMLCQPATREEAKMLLGTGQWIAERKYDGVRALIKGGRIFDRRGKDITKKFPEFNVARMVGEPIDGEIIAASGKFDDISGRMHVRDAFKISLSARLNPAIFMAFDVVMEGVAWSQRRGRLMDIGVMEGSEWFKISGVLNGSFEEMWGEVEAGGWEGLVLKRKSSEYYFGMRSPDWRKVKAFVEATEKFTKLEEHPKGVRLETDDGHAVNVNGAQAEDVKKIFKREGSVTCEVQYLQQRESDAWRFPSFRGVVDG